MANIRVTCPTCGKALEVGAEYDGKEVECGECFQVFVAKGTGGGKIRGAPSARGSAPASRPADRPKPRRRATRMTTITNTIGGATNTMTTTTDLRGAGDAEVATAAEDSASGTAVAGVIVGVFALLTSCCPVSGIGLGIVAMVLGAVGKKNPGSSGAATAAALLGSIAFLISVGLIAFWFALGGANRFGN